MERVVAIIRRSRLRLQNLHPLHVFSSYRSLALRLTCAIERIERVTHTRLSSGCRTLMSHGKASPLPGPAGEGDDVRSIAVASTTASSGTRRKRANEPRFYAVKEGHKPGVYANYNDCLEQVKGFKGAVFKSFPSAEEAQDFISGSSSAQPPDKFYGVQNGRVPGVYTDWPSAQKQVTGWTRPSYKAFSTYAEADAFVKQGRMAAGETDVQVEQEAPSAKKHKKAASEPSETDSSAWEPGLGPLPQGAEDGFDARIILNPETGEIKYKTDEQMAATKKMAVGESRGGMLNIYTDGSALGNGKNGSVAGVGVYFGPLDKRNVSEGLAGFPQTNQRAELTAIQHALDLVPLDRDATIFTDSTYAINCLTVWYVNWRSNNWMTAAKRPVENRDLIEPMRACIDERESRGTVTKLTWIKGHASDPGNVQADELAVQGAKNARAALLKHTSY